MNDPSRRKKLAAAAIRARHAVLIGASALWLAACSSATRDILRGEHRADTPRNLIERALSQCPTRVEAGETACLKTALADSQAKLSDLIALMPGCRSGRVCHYDYTTDDRVGYLDAATSHFVVRWRAEFDLRKVPKSLGGIPVTVKQVELTDR